MPIRRRDLIRQGLCAAAGLSLVPLRDLEAVVPARQSPPAFDEIDRLVRKLMTAAAVPGVSIAVVDDGRVAWRGAFGVCDAAARVPVRDDSLFAVASVSKTVFAYAAMNLCDKGVVGLDTPLVHYASARLLDGDPRLDRITARHVLSHTSGLQNWRSGSDPLRIHFEPGERYLYSGEGYFYLQSVITDVRGRRDPTTCARFEADVEVCGTDIDAYLRASVLEPFGMRDTTYRPAGEQLGRVARPHDLAGTPLPVGSPSAPALARYAAAGGLFTTASDYARFLTEVIDPKPADVFRLSRPTRDEMIRAHVRVDASSSWALGWQVRHTPAGDLIQHQGGQDGVQAFVAANAARRSGYVILTNSAHGGKVFYDRAFVSLMDRYLFNEGRMRR